MKRMVVCHRNESTDENLELHLDLESSLAQDHTSRQ